MSFSQVRTCVCKQPFSRLDGHDLCPTCRPCSRIDPCEICVAWTEENWADFVPSSDAPASSEHRGMLVPSQEKSGIASIEIGSQGDRSTGTTELSINPPPVGVSLASITVTRSSSTGEPAWQPPLTTSVAVLSTPGSIHCSNVSSFPGATAYYVDPGATQYYVRHQRPAPELGVPTPGGYALAGPPPDTTVRDRAAYRVVSSRDYYGDHRAPPPVGRTENPYSAPLVQATAPGVARQQDYIQRLTSVLTEMLSARAPQWGDGQGVPPANVQPSYTNQPPASNVPAPVTTGRPVPHPPPSEAVGTRSDVPPSTQRKAKRRRKSCRCQKRAEQEPVQSPSPLVPTSGSKSKKSRKSSSHTPSATVSRPDAPITEPDRSTLPVSSQEGGTSASVTTDSQATTSSASVSVARSRSAEKRYSTPNSSDDDDDSDTTLTHTTAANPDALTVHAPSRDSDLDGPSSAAVAPQPGASSARPPRVREEDDSDESQSIADDASSRHSDYYSYRRCLLETYRTFPDKCTPPPPPPQSESHILSAIGDQRQRSDYRSLPNSLAFDTAVRKVQNEIAGKEPNTLPLPIGKYPAVSAKLRNRHFRTHNSLVSTGPPKLDSDASKIDNQSGAFKSLSIDRSAFRTLGQSVNATARVLSHLEWLVAVLVRKIGSLEDNPELAEFTRAVGNTLTSGIECTVRSHAILQLLERDAFLNRSSVQLSDELKARLRVVPLDNKNLFAGQLAAFAQEATKDVQSNAWLFGRGNKRTDTPSATRSKASSAKPKSKGKARNKSFKSRAQPYHKGDRGDKSKKFSTSTPSGSGPKGQQS